MFGHHSFLDCSLDDFSSLEITKLQRAFFIAAFRGHTEVVMKLIKAGELLRP
jgi:hypothetical protein